MATRRTWFIDRHQLTEHRRYGVIHGLASATMRAASCWRELPSCLADTSAAYRPAQQTVEEPTPLMCAALG